MEKFLVVFGDTQVVYTEEQLKNFIEGAVFLNKDINNFKVYRLERVNEELDEDGDLADIYDLVEYSDEGFPKVALQDIDFLIRTMADLAIRTDYDNALDRFEQMAVVSHLLGKYDQKLADLFNVSALRLMNNSLNVADEHDNYNKL